VDSRNAASDGEANEDCGRPITLQHLREVLALHRSVHHMGLSCAAETPVGRRCTLGAYQ